MFGYIVNKQNCRFVVLRRKKKKLLQRNVILKKKIQGFFKSFKTLNSFCKNFAENIYQQILMNWFEIFFCYCGKI